MLCSPENFLEGMRRFTAADVMVMTCVITIGDWLLGLTISACCSLSTKPPLVLIYWAAPSYRAPRRSTSDVSELVCWVWSMRILQRLPRRIRCSSTTSGKAMSVRSASSPICRLSRSAMPRVRCCSLARAAARAPTGSPTVSISRSDYRHGSSTAARRVAASQMQPDDPGVKRSRPRDRDGVGSHPSAQIAPTQAPVSRR